VTRASALLAALASLLASCADPVVTQVIVTVDADREIRALARRLDVQVYGGVRRAGGIPDEGMESFPIYLMDEDPEGGDSPWPAMIALAPKDEDASRQYRIIVTARRGEEFIAEVRAISGYVRGQTLWLRLYMDALCLYVEPCTSEDQTCSGGECVSARSPEDTLPRFGTDAGPVIVCETDAECDDGLGCTADECTSARCVSTPNDALCTDGPDGACNVTTGCQYSVCEVGVTCHAGPCETPRCIGTTCDPVSMCAPDEVCCGGACMTCDDGNACTDDGCDGTACTHAPRDGQPCEDGLYCTGAEVCTGSSCANAPDRCPGLTCDEDEARCLDCTDDSQCMDEVTPGLCTGVSGAPVCSTMGMRTITTRTGRCVDGACAADPPTMSMESCVRPTDGTMCNDSMFCNGPDQCTGGTCTAGTTNPCVAPTICNEMTDSCITPMMDGGPRDGCVTGPEICDNGINDNCHPAIDCADPSCIGMSNCMDAGMGDGCVVSMEICDNFADDDCDGLEDCFDSNCTSDPACFDAGMDDGCVVSMEICDNFADDDCDGLEDCFDPGCASDPACFDAGADGCVDGAEICDNGINDDCNPAIDCADPMCFGTSECEPDGGSGDSGLMMMSNDGGLP
jgi:hypothetical protein